MRSLPGLAVALWLGAMGFFGFFVAPAAFATLEREAAGRFVNAIFPRYYLVGAALGLLALASVLARGALKGWRGRDWVAVGLVGVMLALTLYARIVVLPAAHAAREAMRGAETGAGQAESLRFARLHRVAGALNVAVMIAGVTFLTMEVTRRP
ncbi:MAG TPA: DUF4149 domain-containing protein [Candidatus Methylomirabilis sp.]|nr:DUF4149 domain-containing protein [Candidatus Methylomirabilis sp.]